MSSETSLGPSKRAVEKSAKAIKLPDILYSPFKPLVVDKFDGELNRFNAPLNTPIIRMLNVVAVKKSGVVPKRPWMQRWGSNPRNVL